MDLGSGSGTSTIVVLRLLACLLFFDFPYAVNGGGEGSRGGEVTLFGPTSLLVHNLRLRVSAYQGSHIGNA